MPYSIAAATSIRKVVVTIAAGDQISCTFTNQRRSVITARIFHDANGNGRRSLNEAWLPGWTVQLYTSAGLVAEPQITNGDGVVRFANLIPGNYVICETSQSGWLNTTPSALDVEYNQPCYRLTLSSGQAVGVRFGNMAQSTALSSAVAVDPALAVRTGPLPDTDDEGNQVALEADLWAEEESAEELTEMRYQFFLPLLAQ